MLRFENKGTTISVRLPKTDYTVYMMAFYNKYDDVYKSKVYITRNDTDELSFVQSGHEFAGNTKTLRYDMAEYITAKFNKGFFNYFIERYEYQQKCLNIGVQMVESGETD